MAASISSLVSLQYTPYSILSSHSVLFHTINSMNPIDYILYSGICKAPLILVLFWPLAATWSFTTLSQKIIVLGNFIKKNLTYDLV